eukprot:COSAG02_NODE_2635_length_8365_cov_2.690056_6_plen_624_part_00
MLARHGGPHANSCAMQWWRGGRLAMGLLLLAWGGGAKATRQRAMQSQTVVLTDRDSAVWATDAGATAWGRPTEDPPNLPTSTSTGSPDAAGEAAHRRLQAAWSPRVEPGWVRVAETSIYRPAWSESICGTPGNRLAPAEIVVPDNVTEVPREAFWPCDLTSVRKIILPVSVEIVPLGGPSGMLPSCPGNNPQCGNVAARRVVVCVDTDQSTAMNLPWIPTCQMTCAEGEIVPFFDELDESRAPTCTLCPFPQRCLGDSNGCAEGAWGAGCSDCKDRYFALSGECIECPEGASLELPILLGSAAFAAICVGVWKLSASPDVADAVEKAQGNANAVAAIQGQVNNAVAFVSIAAFHLQLSAIKLSLPGIPFPAALRIIARWMDNIIGFDLGELASPECHENLEIPGAKVRGKSYETFVTKMVLINATFFVLMLALWLAGKYLGRRNHARNAMLAAYTLMLTVLAKTHVRWLDCTDGYLDVAPYESCETHMGMYLLASPILFYFVFVPTLIMMALRRNTKLPCCGCCKCCDSLAVGEPFNYDASYGWITRKYAPSCRWFELAVLAYKVTAVFACGGSRCLVSLSPRILCVCFHFSDSNGHCGRVCARTTMVRLQSCLTARRTLGSC